MCPAGLRKARQATTELAHHTVFEEVVGGLNSASFPWKLWTQQNANEKTYQPTMISCGFTFLCSSYMFRANSMSIATCRTRP